MTVTTEGNLCWVVPLAVVRAAAEKSGDTRTALCRGNGKARAASNLALPGKRDRAGASCNERFTISTHRKEAS